MLKKRLIGLMTLVLCAGLTLAACGDDPAEGNNGNNTNNTADTGPDADEGDAGDVDEDTGEQGCLGDEDCADGEVCKVASGACVPAPSGCELTGDERPERCDQSFDEIEFGSVSLVNEFVIAGRVVGDEIDPECCFDYTGDTELDNALGETLLTVSEDTFHSVNQSIADSIADGSLLLMFEHDGLTDLTASEDYSLNFWLGERDESGDLLIDPASVDQGTYPQARVENAVIQDGTLSAGPGTVALSIDLLDTPLSLVISQAQIEAEVDMDNSTVEDGIILTDGQLGGVVRVTDIYDGLNTFTKTCDCLGLEEDQNLIDYQFDAESGLIADCNAGSSEANVCEDAGESSCAQIASNCGLISGVLPSFADVDLDGDGINDAISIGAKFSTEAATVVGIAPAE